MKKSFASITALSILLSSAAQAAIPLRTLRTLEKSTNLNKNIKGDIFGTLGSGSEPTNWFNLSPELDGVEGVGTERAYTTFGAPQQEIIVAVIDSGVDVNHEDLQGKVWVNEGEIADNGIDDDNNGYIDDVYGWNFIGNKEGMAKIVSDDSLNGYKLIKGDPSMQVDGDTLEVTRELVRLTKLQKELNALGYDLNRSDKKLLKEVKAEVEKSYADAKGTYDYLKSIKDGAEVLKAAGVEDINMNTVSSFEATTEEQKKAKNAVLSWLSRGYDMAALEDYYHYYAGSVLYHYNTESDTRKDIVKDNYSDQNEKDYGNNDVIGPDSSHGTHVAGIIAAARDNGIGMNGVASNVKIMAVRCVPNGDERDKDVANSIYYAVNNGAKVINMSFGKSYSPFKKIVDDAVKYAESKGVLLVHAAGNSAQDNDTAPNFPNAKVESARVSNWIEVGASAFKKGASLAADFSNFGQVAVDVFAPGKNINATFPDNTYSTISGTSMASPVVAGVAAAILGHYPNLVAAQVKEAIVASSTRYPNLVVSKKGIGTVFFSRLSNSGAIANLFNALEALNTKTIVPFKAQVANY